MGNLDVSSRVDDMGREVCGVGEGVGGGGRRGEVLTQEDPVDDNVDGLVPDGFVRSTREAVLGDIGEDGDGCVGDCDDDVDGNEVLDRCRDEYARLSDEERGRCSFDEIVARLGAGGGRGLRLVMQFGGEDSFVGIDKQGNPVFLVDYDGERDEGWWGMSYDDVRRELMRSGFELLSPNDYDFLENVLLWRGGMSGNKLMLDSGDNQGSVAYAEVIESANEAPDYADPTVSQEEVFIRGVEDGVSSRISPTQTDHGLTVLPVLRLGKVDEGMAAKDS